MKLSLWILDDWLKRNEIVTKTQILAGDSSIEGIRIFGDPNEDPTFLVINETLLGGNENKCQINLMHMGDTIVIEGQRQEHIINLIQQAFEYYNKWEVEMLMCLIHKKHIQDLLEIAYRVFQRPMFIKSVSSWVLAITKGYEPDIHPYWTDMEESVTHRTSRFDMIKTVSLDKNFQSVFTQKYPIVIESPLYKGYVMHSNVWTDNSRTCEIVTLEDNKPLTQRDVQLMDFFTRMVEMFIKNSNPLYVSSSDYSSFFLRLLEGSTPIQENLKFIYDISRWKENDEFVVMCIESKSKHETPIVRVLQDKIQEQLSAGCAFLYENQIVCVINLTQTGTYNELIKLMKTLIPKDAFYWGSSYEFVNIEKFTQFYNQALCVLSYAISLKKSYRTMYQVAYLNITDQLRDLKVLSSSLHPDLVKLIDFDKKQSTNYLNTLFEYLFSGCNYTDAANRLGLHRNSLIYRISKIEELMSSDLNDYDNKKLLLVSMLIMNMSIGS